MGVIRQLIANGAHLVVFEAGHGLLFTRRSHLIRELSMFFFFVTKLYGESMEFHGDFMEFHVFF